MSFDTRIDQLKVDNPDAAAVLDQLTAIRDGLEGKIKPAIVASMEDKLLHVGASIAAEYPKAQTAPAAAPEPPAAPGETVAEAALGETVAEEAWREIELGDVEGITPHELKVLEANDLLTVGGVVDYAEDHDGKLTPIKGVGSNTEKAIFEAIKPYLPE